MNKLSRRIFLDRYALKDNNKELCIGDVAIIVVKDDPKWPITAIGKITSIYPGIGAEVVVTLDEPMWDGTEMVSSVVVPREGLSIPVELEPQDMWRRVASGLAAVEGEDVRAALEAEFYSVLEGWQFVPGGRILATAGTSQRLTMFNCYVVPSPKDSRGGIISTLGHMVEIFSRGGGVGVNVSSLRPSKARVVGVNGRSSGAVSWGALYSFATGLISQGGSRRGALLIALHDWHPDLMGFINAKKISGYIENANMSIALSDAFMAAAENREPWELKFPDTTHPKYDNIWDGDIHAWESSGLPVVSYGTVDAHEVLRMLTDAAWASAEPGILWLERANKQSNSYYYQKISCSNPCGEVPLPPDGVCTLSHVNLSTVFDPTTGKVNWKKLRWLLMVGYRALDNVIDVTPYFDADVEEEAKRSRRLGFGTMGLAELLIKMKLPYRATPKTLAFIDRLYGFITCTLYEASSNMAVEKGSFPAFDAELFLESGFAKTLPERIRGLIRKQGLRNICLTTQAPTGSTGSMVGTSTGIEPFFAVRGMERKSRLGTDAQHNNVIEQWILDNPGKKLPSYFVGAMDITPEDHIRIQAVIQRWTDSSISKTVNVPNSATKEEIFDLHILAYDLGCKGVTIYRDGSRDEQVLTVNPDAEVYIEDDETVAAEEVDGPPLIFMHGARKCEACGNISMFDADVCEHCEVCGAGACSR